MSLCLLALAGATARADILRIGGTGGATEAMNVIGARFSKATGIAVEIVPGLGSSGGIAAAADGVLGLAVSGRPLTAGEVAHGLTNIVTVCTPYVLATSHPSPGSIDNTAIAAAYAQPAPIWPDGMPLRIILRPKAESDNAVLAGLFPGLGPAIAVARERPAVPIAGTDQDNATLAEQISGSLTGTTYSQVMTEHRNLRLIAINGVQPGLETYESGQYSYGKSLYLIAAEKPAPEVGRFVDFIRSTDGGKAMRDAGMVTCRRL